MLQYRTLMFHRKNILHAYFIMYTCMCVCVCVCVRVCVWEGDMINYLGLYHCSINRYGRKYYN